MKIAELTKMEIWNNEVGSKNKRVPVPYDNNPNKFMVLGISQHFNDRRNSMSTKIKFGGTGYVGMFYGGGERIGRVVCTVPDTLDNIANKREALMSLYDPIEKENVHFVYPAVNAETGDAATFVYRRVYDRDLDCTMTEIVLGNTGQAIAIVGGLTALRQTWVSMPYDCDPTPVTETITLKTRA